MGAAEKRTVYRMELILIYPRLQKKTQKTTKPPDKSQQQSVLTFLYIYKKNNLFSNYRKSLVSKSPHLKNKNKKPPTS